MQYIDRVLEASKQDELITSTDQHLTLDGWGALVTNHQTRAFVLLAMINIILENFLPPTGMEILEQVQVYQAALDEPQLSRNSLRIVLTHIESLIQAGYVFKTSFTDHEEGANGRGGRSRSYWPSCIGLTINKE